MPVSNHILQPVVATEAFLQNVVNKKRQREYYDKTAKVLPQLHPDDSVRIHINGVWQIGVVKDVGPTPQSYLVTTETGNWQTIDENHGEGTLEVYKY